MRTEYGLGPARLPRPSAPPLAGVAEAARNTDSLPAMQAPSSISGGLIVLAVTALTAAMVYSALLYLS
jgi:hypothetical protein